MVVLLTATVMFEVEQCRDEMGILCACNGISVLQVKRMACGDTLPDIKNDGGSPTDTPYREDAEGETKDHDGKVLSEAQLLQVHLERSTCLDGHVNFFTPTLVKTKASSFCAGF